MNFSLQALAGFFNIYILAIIFVIIVFIFLIKITKNQPEFEDLRNMIYNEASNPFMLAIHVPYFVFIIITSTVEGWVIQGMILFWFKFKRLRVGKEGIGLESFRASRFADIQSNARGIVIKSTLKKYCMSEEYNKLFSPHNLYNFNPHLYLEFRNKQITDEYIAFAAAIFDHRPSSSSSEMIFLTFVTIMVNQIVTLAFFNFHQDGYIERLDKFNDIDWIREHFRDCFDENKIKIDEFKKIIIAEKDDDLKVGLKLFSLTISNALARIDYCKTIRTALNILDNLTPSNCITQIKELQKSVQIAEDLLGRNLLDEYFSLRSIKERSSNFKDNEDHIEKHIDRVKKYTYSRSNVLSQKIDNLLIKKLQLFTALYAHHSFYKSDFLS